MEIKENEYIRYIPTNGYTVIISKVTKIENRMLDNAYYLDDSKEEVYSSHFDDIIKHSKDIIDLIEVGDYVNGYKVSYKDNDYKPFVQCDYPVQEGTTNHYRFYEEAIYSIVTKEQFEANAYKIEKEKIEWDY